MGGELDSSLIMMESKIVSESLVSVPGTETVPLSDDVFNTIGKKARVCVKYPVWKLRPKSLVNNLVF